MSAFMLSKTHIDALVTYATGGGPYRVSGEDPQKLGKMLWEQNHRSVNWRYRDNAPVPPYRYSPYIKPLQAVAVLKMCDCYDYQSCETDDYEKTDAARLIDAIRGKAVRSLPGYESAPWGLEDAA